MKIVPLKTATPIRFGTDGWRGVIGDEFTFTNLERIVQAYADYLITIRISDSSEKFSSSSKTPILSPLIIIGYDGRFLSKEFAYRTAEILAGNHFDFELFDEPVPTPIVSWAVRQRNADGGIIITASHNCAEFNGFKIKSAWGGSAPDNVTTAVESFIDYQHPKIASIPIPDHSEFVKSVFDSYKRQVSDFIDLDKVCAAENRVIIDSMHGVGGYWLENFLRKGKVKPETIRAASDPLFGGGQPEPVDLNLFALKKRVLDTNAILGVATDGDADRFGVVNERGETVSMHNIASILLLHMIRQRNMTGSIVRSFSQSSLIKRIAQAHNLSVYDVPVGFKYITDLMIRKNILIGTEESGGIGVQGHLPERDGILNSLLLLETIVTLDKTLSEIVNELHREFGEFHFRSCNLKMSADNDQDFLVKLARNPPRKIADELVSDVEILDGVKFRFADDSWLLFRQSGTESLVRIYSEATSINKAHSFVQAGKAMVSNSF